MLCYFPGGMLADRFPPRKLMSFSLFATALGGLYLSTFPTGTELYFLFGYWGCTSILLFWAAMIKQTRTLAGQDSQGVAFGLLDGGRGLVASIVASIAVVIFASFLVQNNELNAVTSLSDSPTELLNKQQAMRAVILFYTGMTCLAALLVWFLLPKEVAHREARSTQNHEQFSFGKLFEVLKDSRIWFQGGIIVCAYCGYKSLDNYGIYATQILNMSQVDAASLTAFASYARPVAALAAGLIADRWAAGKTVIFFFAICTVAFIIMSLLSLESIAIELIIANIVLTFVGVYALRGIYFALIEQSKVNLKNTGTAVGLISLVGYTPDIFFASIAGRILDANPGFVGFQNYFLFLAAVSFVGILFAYAFNRSLRSKTV